MSIICLFFPLLENIKAAPDVMKCIECQTEVNDSVFDHFSSSAVFCVNCGTNGVSIYHCENKQTSLTLTKATLVFGSEKSSETFLILDFFGLVGIV